MTPWLSIIGIGEDGLAGLSDAARTLIAGAELLVGGARHLAMVPPGRAERLAWERPLKATVARIAARRGRPVAVLASGDPMCYGVGVTLARRFDRAEMTILPQLGAFSLAAARLAWPLADCETLTLHGRPLERLLRHLAPDQRLLVLSEDGGTPAAIARLLCAAGWGPSRLAVLEHLGGAAEAVIEASAADWGERRCADLNTVAILCRAGPEARILPRAAGLPDDAFLHDGQITKRELRAATLAALAPLPGQLLWDVGAGCGSIAIEWLRAAPRTAAIAIERDAARRYLIARNAAALGVPELRIQGGEAPAALAGLPQPQAVFLGGGIATAGLLDSLWDTLPAGGRLVANAVTLAGEAALAAFCERRGGALTRIAVARAAPIGAQLAWRPLLPVTQLAATKPGAAA
ncbi:MAG TPA: precorrin-6y C5,15-methyltransferase (decarboxylating) subunit CbiE [Stellaceae bacterium]|nr:precorrin-6y C5,15-methyltransferase (decarboxylating) subunit CbiE [Stellaceae bacterium]